MELAVGHRVSLGQHRGTIRYRGPVPPSTGEWLGIEWDDPARGKHSGALADGTQYFHVRVPGSGSFIRPTASKLSSGCCFLEALRNKYLPPTEEAKSEREIQHKYTRKNIADIEIEAPNLDRIAKRAAKLDRLKEIGLGGWQQSNLPDVEAENVHDPRYDVAKAFDGGKGYVGGSINKTCPNIRWLDLSRSLLSDWEEVSLIAGELAHLKTLLLHFNRFQSPPKKVPQTWIARLRHVQDLRLDETLMQWEELVRLAPALDGLLHLQLGYNGISRLVTSSIDGTGSEEMAAILPSLVSLSLEGNAIESWPGLVAALSSLPSLESLNLNRNRVVAIPAATPSSRKLSKLKELHLRDNQIESWSTLEHIAQWLGRNEGLEALHVSTICDEDDPQKSSTAGPSGLLSMYEYRDFRAITIARLPSLKILDKTEITFKERKDAELFVYTRFHEGDAYIINGNTSASGKPILHDSEEKLNLTTEEKSSRFPRYLELAKLFDGDDSATSIHQTHPKSNKKMNTLRSKMLTLTVFAAAAAPSMQMPHLSETKAEAKVQLLISTPLRLAKIKLANSVGVKAAQIAQIWALLKQPNEKESEEENGERIVLEVDDMSRNLDWYEVNTGDQLVLVIDA
ncbi:related to PAC2 - microtubule effector required for tubulin heterodimer formation [Melanopsichium pennsylvanicum]|uniref:Related to PAC2 - microtubule effector required for tubulin heterodimer formation n=2 Tax=Melanopsichium pennsylvanicum TaxID=63383 RepID=A0AAJ4XI31_9BASI|nr:beta-tubulin folding cofactor e [Melanopsichium pennsylvanicum 4]SNX82762.1 related to PAC2 - microtubule effector required for tubulin heterodimer formation [Melanopsichium pennsylvanicum]